MKEAIIVDLNGYFTDTMLVADDVTGVFPLYRTIDVEQSEDEEPQEPEQELYGYQVAIPVTEGLYKPKFDLLAWEDFNKPLEPQLDKNGDPIVDDDGNIIYLPRPQVQLWIEGLTQEEIDAIKNAPRPKSTEEKVQEQSDKIDLLSGNVELIDQRTLGLQDTDFFTLDRINVIDDRGLGMQDVDDYILSLIMDLQTQVDELKARIQQLEGTA